MANVTEKSVDTVDRCYIVAVRAAKYVGGIIKSRIWEAKGKVTTKSSAMDFVTETDREVETYLKSTIKKYFPTHAFIGEEGASVESNFHLADMPTWIVDPIDGTMNFLHGHPSVCVSIAFVINKTPEFGIIYNPILEYFFEARKGSGAKLNGKPIHVSKTTELSNALLCFEFGTSREIEKVENLVNNMYNILEKVQGIRSSGSAAMNMAMIAMGACDAYFEFGIHIWDVMAGELLVKEAGGVVIDPEGTEFDPLSRKILCASNMKLAKHLSKEVIQFAVERDGVKSGRGRARGGPGQKASVEEVPSRTIKDASSHSSYADDFK